MQTDTIIDSTAINEAAQYCEANKAAIRAGIIGDNERATLLWGAYLGYRANDTYGAGEFLVRKYRAYRNRR